MSDYNLKIQQVVDYPRCRVYREFVQTLIADRNIRVNGCSGLFHYTVLCSYANFRTSYRRLDGISYTVYPGEWICRINELQESLRLRTRRQVVAAIVTASVALLMMNFSRSGRTVDESRSWLKRIIITWVILNGLGFIMAYITPFFAGGQWTPTNP